MVKLSGLNLPYFPILIVSHVSFSRPKHAKFDLQGPTILYFHMFDCYLLISVILPSKIKMYVMGGGGQAPPPPHEIRPPKKVHYIKVHKISIFGPIYDVVQHRKSLLSAGPPE